MVPILVVDDSPDMLRLLTRLLEGARYAVRTAESAEEALEILAPGNAYPDLVLMDLQMPGMDGIEACHRIRALPEGADLPVLMVTGSHAESDLQVAFASGAWDYITKPVSKAVLLARVHSALRLKHEMDRRQARELELLEVKAQLEAANETLRVLACLDSVTGLTNRRHFDHVLAQEWNRALRHGYPLGLLLIDVDHFKGFNDFWGHPAGDACLRRIADTLSPLTQRAGDVLARYGGDELVALLVDTDEQGACTVAGRMLHEVRVQQVEHPASPVAPYVTLSIGAASIRPARQAAPDVLVAAADGALYEAKRRGRDQVARQAPLGAPGADLDLPALAAG